LLRQSGQTSNSGSSETLVICPVCERGNPPGHKFCGMCGSTLPQVTRGETARISANASRDDAGDAESSSREPQAFEDSISNPHELSLFRSFRPSEGGDSAWDDEPSSPPYRLYLGLVIGLIVMILAFMGWRKSHQNAQTGLVPVPPIASTEAPAPAANNAAPSGAASTKTQPEARPETERAKAEPTPEKAATPAASTPTRVATKAPATAAHEQPQIYNGSQELATAQRYLSGAAGQRRDPSQAAQWLWKSIAKHNGQATVLLADLFLRGDGVSKNCDQARVLLDSAARKGITGAGERLRNLQAFGCQ
jgi:hypothetical protein